MKEKLMTLSTEIVNASEITLSLVAAMAEINCDAEAYSRIDRISNAFCGVSDYLLRISDDIEKAASSVSG